MNDNDIFPREIVVIKEEEWFGDMNLTDNATFLTTPIKRSKTRVNKKLKYTLQKVMHTGHCNEQWLEHTVCPDIA